MRDRSTPGRPRQATQWQQAVRVEVVQHELAPGVQERQQGQLEAKQLPATVEGRIGAFAQNQGVQLRWLIRACSQNTETIRKFIEELVVNGLSRPTVGGYGWGLGRGNGPSGPLFDGERTLLAR